MASSLSKAVLGLEKRANTATVTAEQRAIVAALREIGAFTAADTIGKLLDQQQAAVEEGLETVRSMKKHGRHRKTG